MSTKKKKLRNIHQLTKIYKNLNVRNQRPTNKAASEKFVHTSVIELMNKKVRSPLLKEIVAHADVSSILKQPGDPLQEDVEEDAFNPPLHSTAVSDGDELLQTSENPERNPAKLMSPIRPVVQEKRRQNPNEANRKSAANAKQNAPRLDTAQAKRTLQKKALPVPESSKKPGTPRNLADGAPPSTQASSTTPSRNVVPAKKKVTPRKEQGTSNKKKSGKDGMETAPAGIWSPENVPKSVRSVNELDVVLFESEKLIELYRENVDTDVCKRAIDVFFNTFKEQLSSSISDLQKLKDLKRKNAKMQSEIGRKRKRLLQVKDEIIAKQPKLCELQKECSELEQKQESLKSARTILDNIVHLQEDYMTFKAKNPHIKETYGTSSLPALCLEAENILKAEQHFHTVNKKLQSFIDEEKGNG